MPVNYIPSELDLFILALVSNGLATPYDLKARAGLSVGSTAPVLNRLEQHGLIEAGARGVRNNRRYKATKAGAEAMRSGWRGVVEATPTDPDQVLRAAYLAWSYGTKQTLVSVLKRGASTLKSLAELRAAEAKQLRPEVGSKASGPVFRWLRTHCDAARLLAQSEAVAELSAELVSKNKKA